MIPIKRTRTSVAANSAARRWATACGVGGLIVSALAGCQTASQFSRSRVEPSPQTAAPPAENPPPSKTDFRKDVSPDQGFNVHVEMARVYESQSNFESAVAEYEKAIELCEKKGALGGAKLGPAQRALAERRMAAAYDRMGKFTQAEVHYSKALDAAPKDAKTWNDIGYSYYLQNRLQDAERSFKTADSVEPNNPKVLTNLGLALAAQGKEDEALTALSRAGGPAVGHANLGFILAAIGKKEEARKHYEAALAARPELEAARLALAQIDSSVKRDQATMVASATSTAPTAGSPATSTAPVASAHPEAVKEAPIVTEVPSAPANPTPPVAEVPAAEKPAEPEIKVIHESPAPVPQAMPPASPAVPEAPTAGAPPTSPSSAMVVPGLNGVPVPVPTPIAVGTSEPPPSQQAQPAQAPMEPAAVQPPAQTPMEPAAVQAQPEAPSAATAQPAAVITPVPAPAEPPQAPVQPEPIRLEVLEGEKSSAPSAARPTEKGTVESNDGKTSLGMLPRLPRALQADPGLGAPPSVTSINNVKTYDPALTRSSGELASPAPQNRRKGVAVPSNPTPRTPW